MRIQLRPVHFLNINVHFALGALLHVGLQLVDFRPFAADDDSRTRCVNSHHQLVGGALHVNPADPRGLQLFLQRLAQDHVFMQQVGIVLLREPARLPDLVVAQPKTVRMCFLPQTVLPLLLLFLSRLISLFQCLARFAYRALHTLRRLRFRRRCRYATGHRAVMFGNFHKNVARPLLVTEDATHRGWSHALSARPFIHEAARYRQLVQVQRLARILRLALRVRDSAAQSLLNILGHALLRELQRVQCFFRAPPANQVNHQPRLLRRDARVTRLGDSLYLRCLACRILNCRCHRLCPLRLRCRSCSGGWCRSRRWRACRCRGPLESRFHRVPFKSPRRRKFTQLVSDHLLGDVHRNELLAVVHRQRVPDHVRQNRRTARPGLQNFLFVAGVQAFHLLTQVAIDERSLLQRARHLLSYSSTRRSFTHCARRTLLNPRTGPETRCDNGQKGQTNRVPCAFGILSTITAQPDRHNRY